MCFMVYKLMALLSKIILTIQILGGIAVIMTALYFLTRPSQEDRDRHAEIVARGKAERKAELKKF